MGILKTASCSVCGKSLLINQFSCGNALIFVRHFDVRLSRASPCLMRFLSCVGRRRVFMSSKSQCLVWSRYLPSSSCCKNHDHVTMKSRNEKSVTMKSRYEKKFKKKSG